MAYKLRIITEADHCTQAGQMGSPLRREGLYSSHLISWRRQREREELGRKQRAPAKWVCLYLFLVLDFFSLYSRYVGGWLVEVESVRPNRCIYETLAGGGRE